MTPPAKGLKRATRSPLHEMDGIERDDDGHDDAGRGANVAQMANIVRNEIQRALAPMDEKLDYIQTSLGQKMQDIEHTVSAQGVRLEKLEQRVAEIGDTPRTLLSDRSLDLEGKVQELQSQLASLKSSELAVQPDHARTMVVGGLDSFSSVQDATKWLTQKLSSLSSPPHIGTYMKSQEFRGLLFAKFKSCVDRDTAVALLRSAELHESGKRIWATQDLPLQKRAQKVFLMGLKWQLGEWGFMKRDMELNDNYDRLKVGEGVVVSLSIKAQQLECQWSDDWAQWAEFQNSSELRQLITRANEMLQKDITSKGKGKSKGGRGNA
ncbi:unnamed protein product [Symbiodinium sp. CCMP2592]|nr:unnamed protein product [Symbiodinium sp. CCMP2592]